MSRRPRYYYDESQCTFVEVERTRTTTAKYAGLMLLVSCLLASGLYWGLYDFFGSPEVVALRSENGVLREQLALTDSRIGDIRGQLDLLAKTDQELYRTILQAEPIAQEIREAGVGGTDIYEDFQRFGTDTRKVLRYTAESLDRLERKIAIQNSSYRDLVALANDRADALRQLPAIMPADGRLVSGFGIRTHPIDRVKRMHSGIDITAPKGTPVVATADGIVKFTGRKGGYGNLVEIWHKKSGYVTRYAHLSDIPRTTRRGRTVQRGEIIAFSGNTGRSTAPHVHYEVLDASGRHVNPINFFAPGMTPSEFERLLKESDEAISPLD